MAAVDVWMSEVTTLADTVEGLLSDDERARADRFLSLPARKLFVVSRALQRTIGARYLGVDEVVVERRCRLCDDDSHGKPYFAADPGLDFSVSHSGSLVAIAVSADCRVGLDIEADDRRLDPGVLADRVLTPAERATLGDEPSRSAFLAMWTRKEATVKLTGHGLTVPFADISVEGHTVTASPVPDGWPDTPLHLATLTLAPGHAAALATTPEPAKTTVYRAESILAG